MQRTTRKRIKIVYLRERYWRKEVKIEILYSGVCHSDIHIQPKGWGPTIYPLVPGHEIWVKLQR
jgi:D-arabinose 1-dehydrogenase-like Zn-dependent alcohol dehydrogenase